MVFHTLMKGFILELILFFSLSVLQLHALLTINSVQSASLSSLYAYNYDEIILVGGRTYTFTAYGLSGFDTMLYVGGPNGYWETNDNWGGSTDPYSSQMTRTVSSGTYGIYVQSYGGSGTYNLYVTDVSPCSSSCSSNVFDCF